MSTSGDSVMQVSDAAGGLVDNMMVCFTSKDVIFFFKKSPNGSVLPRTVTGISNGKNRIEVLDAADSALMRASLTLAN